MDKKTYIQMLSDILYKKEEVMLSLVELTKEQEQILGAEQMDLDSFEAILPKKDSLIEQLNELDKGFDDIYAKVQGELAIHKEEHKNEIISLQQLIRRLTEYGVVIEATEQRNRDKLERYLAERKEEFKNFKVSNRTASSYYKNMGGRTEGESYFLDKRK